MNSIKILKWSLFFVLPIMAYGFYGKHPMISFHESPVIAEGAELQLVSDQFSFTEGPAVDKAGNIYFTDQPNDKIWVYDTSGKLSLFLSHTGRSNGLYFDDKGHLIACADENNQLWSINKKGKAKVLLTNFMGKRFNGPNDLWIHPNGNIYFTDPYYERDYWKVKKQEMEGERVYLLKKGEKQPIIVASNLQKPNGITGSPDGKYLYVADIKGGKTFRYAIDNEGTLSDTITLLNKGSDGLTLDDKGNIYITGDGVTVFNKEGQQIEHIAVPEKWTANVCLGGKDRNILFITASKSVYTLQMKVKGVE